MTIEEIEQRAWGLDMETFNDCITIGATKYSDHQQHVDFAFYGDRNDRKAFKKWAKKELPILITFNGIDFDLQIIQYLLDSKVRKPEVIYKWVQEKLINGGKFKPYRPSELSFQGIDLLKINNYGWGPKSTSLKWLEFSMRMPKMADLPIDHTKKVSEANFDKILSYQKYDIKVTMEFARRCWSMIKMLSDVSKTYKDDSVMNFSDSKLGNHVMKHEYAKTAKVKVNSLKSGTDRNKVKLKKCILPYIKFKSQALTEVLDKFKDTVITKIKDEFSFKGALSQSAFFAGIKMIFGLGGLHAAVKPSAWKSGWYDDNMNLIISSQDFNYAQKTIEFFDERVLQIKKNMDSAYEKRKKTNSDNIKRKCSREINQLQDNIDELTVELAKCTKNIKNWNKKIDDLTEYVIKSADVTSYYPFLAIRNGFIPKHLGKQFTKAYHGMFKKRIKYAKGTAENYMYKIALNGTFGKSNTKHDQWLKDPKYLADTTINGQLLLAMLAEELSDIGELLMINTDGLEIFMPASNQQKYEKICEKWMKLTELKLEFDNYDVLHISDVNNYHGIYDSGKVKRKGQYMIYYDYTEEDGKPHAYHKNPSACVIPMALNAYFTKGTPIKDTINNCNNIYEFLYGIKKKRNFDHVLDTCENNIIVKSNTYNERAMRYYVSTDGGNLRKFWKDGRKGGITALHKGCLVTPAMIIPRKGKIKELVSYTDPETGKKSKKENDRYPGLDRPYYINQAQKILDSYDDA